MSTVIPPEFECPILLTTMDDPVIVQAIQGLKELVHVRLDLVNFVVAAK